ncbi:hypothetical protein SCLCIDRAFT_1212155 [Scleroderma citrinum Foug A]|uniref:Uncharacterized protein n=1 Tax=Scleroderma citrinum Foug A TaxID=1036808 RepID=A0A0C3AKD7_9AGAM|nr:hypothetical protein SCLCIDRAFT_1212155 [Scleroderma citrinum Foug A]
MQTNAPLDHSPLDEFLTSSKRSLDPWFKSQGKLALASICSRACVLRSSESNFMQLHYSEGK